MKIKLKGYYRVCLRGKDGVVHTDTGWFPNLITNQGLDQFGSAAFTYNDVDLCVVSRCAVGTSNTAPTVADTALNAEIAYAPTTSAGVQVSQFTNTYVAGPPSYWSSVYTYIFTLGSVVGNIAEVGTGGLLNSSSTTISAFSHALIVDGGGTPTTISVTSADQLEVTFELRQYIDTTDTAYSLTISGTGYSGTIRRASVNSTSGLYIMAPVDMISIGGGLNAEGFGYNGSIGAITTFPSGTQVSLGTLSVGSYTPGSYTKSFTWTATTTEANVAGGISALQIKSNFGNWQLSVSPVIAKDNTKTMTLQFSISWARYP